MGAVNALLDGEANATEYLPRGTEGRRGPARTLLFDVAKGLARRIPLTKLVELDQDVRPYLAALMVAAMQRAGQQLTIPRSLAVEQMPDEQFNAWLTLLAGHQYHAYGNLGQTWAAARWRTR